MSISKALLVTAALCVAACDDPETAARAVNVLEHGMVYASAECASNWHWPWSTTPGHNLFKVQVMQDGSVLKSFSSHATDPAVEPPYPLQYCSRSEACAVPSYSFTGDYTHVNHAEVSLADGVFSVVLTGADINSETPPYGNLSPLTVFTDDIGDVCTGFNFEAFGVE